MIIFRQQQQPTASVEKSISIESRSSDYPNIDPSIALSLADSEGVINFSMQKRWWLLWRCTCFFFLATYGQIRPFNECIIIPIPIWPAVAIGNSDYLANQMGILTDGYLPNCSFVSLQLRRENDESWLTAECTFTAIFVTLIVLWNIDNMLNSLHSS